MVLSIGLLVDDAIVVIENVERVMREERLGPREATVKSMQQITGALIGVAMSLAAVFLPMAFFGGSTGVIYRQFSVTIVASMALSVFVALTLTPALCATLLQPIHDTGRRHGLFGWFNHTFDRLSGSHESGVTRIIKRPLRWMLTYAVIVGVLAVLFLRLPTSFLPDEDQGEIMVMFTLPTGATMARTEEVTRQVEQYFLTKEKDNFEAIMAVDGFGFSGRGPNAGAAFISLKDWSQRKAAANRADAIVLRAIRALSSIRDAQVFALNPPAIMGLGQVGGFEFQLLSRAGTSRATLRSLRDTLLSRAGSDPKLMAVRLGTLEDTPQLQVDIDQPKASSLGLSLADVNSTLNAAWGGTYVNDFIDRDRVKKVFIQGEAGSRSSPDDLSQWYVRGGNGTRTPFSAFATTRWTYGPETLSRFNGLPSYSIQGSAAPGVSSSAAMDEMERLASQLPPGTSSAFSGLSYQERLAGSQTTQLYTISILVVFLCLAALYESWSVPLSVLLVIPLGIVGSVLAANLRGLENNIYFQVALLTTIGLSAKNAILIVEFAEESYRRGSDLIEATVHAARLRLRPILMTSLAFIAGVLPLAVSTGAGANGRVSIGTGIVGGTLSATALAIFFVPLFFVLVRTLFPRRTLLTQQVATAGAGVSHA
jgi:multidrug efflux pump